MLALEFHTFVGIISGACSVFASEYGAVLVC